MQILVSSLLLPCICIYLFGCPYITSGQVLQIQQQVSRLVLLGSLYIDINPSNLTIIFIRPMLNCSRTGERRHCWPLAYHYHMSAIATFVCGVLSTMIFLRLYRQSPIPSTSSFRWKRTLKQSSWSPIALTAKDVACNFRLPIKHQERCSIRNFPLSAGNRLSGYLRPPCLRPREVERPWLKSGACHWVKCPASSVGGKIVCARKSEQ